MITFYSGGDHAVAQHQVNVLARRHVASDVGNRDVEGDDRGRQIFGVTQASEVFRSWLRQTFEVTQISKVSGSCFREMRRTSDVESSVIVP